jgi:hypothetical protein
MQETPVNLIKHKKFFVRPHFCITKLFLNMVPKLGCYTEGGGGGGGSGGHGARQRSRGEEWEVEPWRWRSEFVTDLVWWGVESGESE